MLNSFFNLTKKERKASMYFALFLMLLIGIKYFATVDKGTSVITVSKDAKIIDLISEKSVLEKSVNHKSQKVFKKKPSIKAKSRVVVSSVFDPNHLSLSEWMTFGLSEKQATSVLKYISSKGGLVNAKELLDIYVLTKEDKEVLASWCKIEKGKINEWNQADFKNIKGIGDVLSERIIKYRNKLGGFYALNQLDEVYGLDSVVVDKIKERTKTTDVRLILINTLSYKDLINHPYIGKKDAKEIIKQRSITPFSENSQLFEVFSEESKAKRLEPYISYE
jgi:competence protein ComEA